MQSNGKEHFVSWSHISVWTEPLLPAAALPGASLPCREHARGTAHSSHQLLPHKLSSFPQESLPTFPSPHQAQAPLRKGRSCRAQKRWWLGAGCCHHRRISTAHHQLPSGPLEKHTKDLTGTSFPVRPQGTCGPYQEQLCLI